MGYQELLDALGRQVEEEKAKVLAEADRRGQMIQNEARREIERMEAAYAAEDFRDAHLEREKLLAQVSQETAIASLTARREAVETVRNQLRERLGALRAKPSYRKLLEMLIDEVVREMPDVGAWAVDKRDVALVQQILRERKTAGADRVKAGEDGIGGVVALSGDGRARVLNTFDARIAKAWGGLEAGIGGHLIGEPRAGG